MSLQEGNCDFGQPHAQCEIDLVQFMLDVAADAYPQLDRVGCLVEIDRLGVACHDRVCRCSSSAVRARLVEISRTLYDVEGFHGNREAYYEPQNSYLNEVLARRSGIPISLGILYMAVANRAGLKTFGVNAPGHFVVGCCAADGPLFVDPFNAGDVLDQRGCQCRIEQMTGLAGSVCREQLRAAAPRDIAARVLRNLKAAHAQQNRWPQVVAVQQRLTALLPHVPQERRDLGLAYLRVGQPGKALGLLEPYLNLCGNQQAEALAPALHMARRMLAEAN